MVAMSGGIDSCVVAAYLHHLGYKVIGVTLQLVVQVKIFLMQKILPFCRLKSTANTLIMPSIESANAACKFAKEACGAAVIGPILIGIKKSVQIAQMSCNYCCKS